jgi:hypothetical protein
MRIPADPLMLETHLRLIDSGRSAASSLHDRSRFPIELLLAAEDAEPGKPADGALYLGPINSCRKVCFLTLFATIMRRRLLRA